MSRKHGRRANDGRFSDVKLDRFRHSEMENETERNDFRPQGLTRKTLNSLGGPYDENRGRRAADERFNDDDNPFENGIVQNWNRRKNWDHFYDAKFDRDASRNHGGALIGHDASHRGRGPRGYSRSDSAIYEDVCEALALSADVDASEIEVSVKEGCVYLTGTVHSRDMKKMAEFEIESISGIKDVQNHLSIDHNLVEKETKRPQGKQDSAHH